MGRQSTEGVCRGGGGGKEREEEGGGGGGAVGEGGGDQLTDVVPRVQEPCLFSAGELEEGPGLGAGREISGSCLQVQIPPLCVSVWRRGGGTAPLSPCPVL